MSFLFGKKKLDPKEQAREWKRGLQHEQRALDRQIRDIEREEMKVKTEVKKAAKQNDMGAVKMLAKELVASRKAKERIITSKAQLNSVMMQIQNQVAMVRVSGALAKSTELMTGMNNLIKIPELNAVARSMGQEMMKAGLIEEMMDDAFENMEEEGLDDAADEEVEKVMQELTLGMLGKAGTVGITKAAEPTPAAAQEEPEDDLDEMQARLAALRG